MAKYVVLMNWTDQGVKAVKDTIDRYHQSQALIESMGGKVETLLWTVGGYDLIVVTEAPDDETLSAILLTLARAGNLRTQTLRALTRGNAGDSRQDAVVSFSAESILQLPDCWQLKHARVHKLFDIARHAHGELPVSRIA